MKYTVSKTEGCCGQITIVYSLSSPIMRDHVVTFASNGFSISKAFQQAGLLNAENATMIVTCQFGSTTLNLKCKIKNCDTQTQILDHVLSLIN